MNYAQSELFPVIEHAHQGALIPQRAKDGYVNATALCSAAGKSWNDYSRLTATARFLQALIDDTGIAREELIITIRGGVPNQQGTWIHPQVAINLGQWLSPEFAVRVSNWVFEWMNGGPQVVERLPYHLRRYVANMTHVPAGHFSVLQELTYSLIAPMEARGYTLPEGLVPDISQGRMFAAWLREREIDPNSFPTYRHHYEDGRRVDARAYPNQLLQAFREHFATVWMPTRSLAYFQEKDVEAIPYLEKLLADTSR